MTPRHAFAVASALALGCGGTDLMAAEVVSASPGGGPSVPPSSTCAWSGAPVLADGTCTGALAQRVFQRAACACGQLTSGGDLVTDGFDSRTAPWAAGGTGGHVGAISGLVAGGLLDVGGSLAVSGGGLDAGTTARIAGDLDVGGALGSAGVAVTVGGAARVGGGIDVSSLRVTGSLTTPPGSARSGAVTAGSLVSAAVSVPPACPCGASDAVDVASIVSQHRSTNDNASIGLAAGALSAVGTSATVELPCGRFYLDRVQGATVTLRATGHAALFIGAGLQLYGALTVELASDAELDLFVAGPVLLPGTVRLGDPTRPRALRVWLSTGNALQPPAGSQVAANVYAPAATLAVNAPLTVYGALMTGSLQGSAPLTVHHDVAVASAASTCGP